MVRARWCYDSRAPLGDLSLLRLQIPIVADLTDNESIKKAVDVVRKNEGG
jgi:hypothetical protein